MVLMYVILANLKSVDRFIKDIQAYVQQFVENGKLFGDSGIKKFYKDPQTLKTFIETKHELPYILAED